MWRAAKEELRFL
uniref:Uncharacterized protein n=1 Tax=Arundo donax TaxID=35708 RepID=A0A0A9C8P0_ARUDO